MRNANWQASSSNLGKQLTSDRRPSSVRSDFAPVLPLVFVQSGSISLLSLRRLVDRDEGYWKNGRHFATRNYRSEEEGGRGRGGTHRNTEEEEEHIGTQRRRSKSKRRKRTTTKRRRRRRKKMRKRNEQGIYGNPKFYLHIEYVNRHHCYLFFLLSSSSFFFFGTRDRRKTGEEKPSDTIVARRKENDTRWRVCVPGEVIKGAPLTRERKALKVSVKGEEKGKKRERLLRRQRENRVKANKRE